MVSVHTTRTCALYDNGAGRSLATIRVEMSEALVLLADCRNASQCGSAANVGSPVNVGAPANEGVPDIVGTPANVGAPCNLEELLEFVSMF
jgi:hypothetical protein